MGAVGGLQELLGEGDVAEHAGQGVVEVVGDAAGQDPDRFQLLVPDDLLLQELPLGHVDHDVHDAAAGALVAAVQVALRAVLAQGVHLVEGGLAPLLPRLDGRQTLLGYAVAVGLVGADEGEQRGEVRRLVCAVAEGLQHEGVQVLDLSPFAGPDDPHGKLLHQVLQLLAGLGPLLDLLFQVRVDGDQLLLGGDLELHGRHQFRVQAAVLLLALPERLRQLVHRRGRPTGLVVREDGDARYVVPAMHVLQPPHQRVEGKGHPSQDQVTGEADEEPAYRGKHHAQSRQAPTLLPQIIGAAVKAHLADQVASPTLLAGERLLGRERQRVGVHLRALADQLLAGARGDGGNLHQELAAGADDLHGADLGKEQGFRGKGIEQVGVLGVQGKAHRVGQGVGLQLEHLGGVVLVLVDLVQHEEGDAEHGDGRGEEGEAQEELELEAGAEYGETHGQRQPVHS